MKRLGPPYLLGTVFGFALSLMTSAHAEVRVNHGPAFSLGKTLNGKLTGQKQLVALYAGWNLVNDPKNFALRREITKDTLRFVDSPFVLKPAELPTSFLNFGYKFPTGVYHDLEFVQTKFGYCQGMTMVTRFFAYFAEFRPAETAPVSLETDPVGWMSYYRARVDSVMEGKPTVIPGFATLKDFSSSPIAVYIKRHVVDQWGLTTALVTNYRHIYKQNFRPLETPADLIALRTRLEKFLIHGFYPRIVLGSQRYSVNDPHVVMATGLAPSDPTDGGCLALSFFNLGSDLGGYPDSFKLCIGDRAWIPGDEELYLYDFARALTK